MARPKTSPPSAISGARREKIRADRVQAVLNVAREVFHQKGFDDATTHEIAVCAGIAKGTLFKYFPTKDALLFAVVNAELAKQHRLAGQRARSETGLLSRLLSFYGRMLEYHIRNAKVSRPFLRLMRPPSIDRNRPALYFAPDLAIKTTKDFVSEAIATGELKAGTSIDDLSANCFSTFLNILNYTLMGGASMNSPHEILRRRLALQIVPLYSTNQ